MSTIKNSYYINKYPIENFWCTKKGVRFDLIERHETLFSTYSYKVMSKTAWYKGNDGDFRRQCHMASELVESEMKLLQDRELHRESLQVEKEQAERNERKRLMKLCECNKVE
jgi:hypothetical protein